MILAAVWGICRLLRGWPAAKEWFLIGFSFLVIATWGYFDLALFLAVLALNFVAAQLIVESVPPRSRSILALIITTDVATLALFKYVNFIGANVSLVTGLTIPSFPLGIPLAISFYTFHLISYLTDLQAGRVKLASAREYLFYLCFFPHVIAGPIVRAWQLVPQIGRTRRVRTDFAMGFHFLVTGFFLKMVLANNLGRIIEPYFDSQLVSYASAPELWLAAFFYYCQIYGDFAGYSLMALGMARLLGYRLPANFCSPMRAGSLREFWQRWHVTLSRWLRDYLYIPLGGNRTSPIRSAQNVIITMLLGGLWHGAGWGFVVWGALHGTGLVVERSLPGRKLPRFAWAVMVQLWVTLAWVFFRCPNLTTAWQFTAKMLNFRMKLPISVHDPLLAGFVFAVPVVAHNFVPVALKAAGRKRLGLILGASTGVMLLLNFIIQSPETVFIYFRF